MRSARKERDEDFFGENSEDRLFSRRCLNCVHGYDENDDDCAACLAGCDMARHYAQKHAGWTDEYCRDDDGEEWN